MSAALNAFPDPVAATLADNFVCEFATVTAKGVPLDTPMLYSIGSEGSSVDVSTGLAYPTKAERARRNSRVGLLVEAPDGGPVVSIAAFASVRDADIQANALRYAHDFRAVLPVIGGGRSWDAMRDAYWYWTRIFIHCAPVVIRWWESAADTSVAGAGKAWRPVGVDAPASDPAPTKAPSAPVQWTSVRDWRARADEVVAEFPAPHLTVADDDGFPLPFRISAARPTTDGFDLEIPGGATWLRDGSASLCFSGRATFVGQLKGTTLAVERMLPELPLVADPNEIFDPTPSVKSVLEARLSVELERRGQPRPLMPVAAPWETDT